VESGVAPQGKHRDNEKQCAQCHTHSHGGETPSEESPAYTGHEFKPTFESCATTGCHASVDAAKALTASVQTEIEESMTRLKASLDQWALTKSPEGLRGQYKELTWEYNTPGHLSNPAEDSKIVGPKATEQTTIPDGIKQARFNLYLIYQDKSKGIHNAPYARHLLKVADDAVKAELAK
jgi:hypothetical protein